MKGWTRRELAVRVVLLLAGLCVAHLGVTLFLQSDLGSDPFNVFVQGLFRGIPWPAFAAMTHGRTHLLVSLVILLVLLAVDRSYVGIGTVLCMALGGPIIDVYTLWLSPVIHGGLPLPLRRLTSRVSPSSRYRLTGRPTMATPARRPFAMQPRENLCPRTGLWWRWCSATS